MLTVSIRRKTLLLVLVTILVTPWASAAGQQFESPRSIQAVERAELDFFSRLWSFLRNAGSKAGCEIDPSGRCMPPSQIKEGCNIDPSGSCTAQKSPSQIREGCHIDPSGRCTPQNPPLQTKAGCNIDPSGHCIP
jgi:hypothetical protein